MDTFISSVTAVMLVFLLTAIGYFCAAKGWMDSSVKRFISKFLLTISVPFSCIYELTSKLNRADLIASLPYLLASLISMLLTFLLAYVTAKFLLRIQRNRLGIFLMMCCVTNAVFIGLPMCSGLFGTSCTVYVMMFYLINTFVIQLVCHPIVRSTGTLQSDHKTTLLDILKLPTVLGVLTGFALVALEIKLPNLINQLAKSISGANIPLALLFTGYIIHETGLKNLRIGRDHIAAMLFRFVVCPAFGVVTCALLGVEGMARDIMIVELAMPVLTMAVVYASNYGADEEFAAQGTTLSTLLSFIVMPILMVILS